MKKPKNAIKDASKAIDLNPDQPLAYRIRGRAHGLLGELVFFLFNRIPDYLRLPKDLWNVHRVMWVYKSLN